jgi:hypothetical protein
MATHPYFRQLVVAAFLSLFVSMEAVVAAPPPPSWSRQIIPTGQERTIVKATPVEMRPNRPLHIYGNTVRRRYNRSTPLPATPAASRSFSGNGISR